ncbi:MAG TPA: cupredoxin family copper-binding protein [Casimicrobiaceae bacterium]|jgi:plastocyanin|nr:cupredoxin family copper-binding protein [Casimicrobiaceae bacterium]HWC44875.1 cupredoxin family copper-binding protein [Casimicrobiaceae bacterium]HWD36028.1 cupredoxin family copper-binding protein [Casimicrobiaceae bacterium]
MVGQRIALLLAVTLLGSGPALVGSDPVFVSTALAATAPATPHVVKIDSFAFKPAVITVKVGDTVEWQNDDPVPHTATSKSGGFDSGSIAAGAKWRYVAKKKGRFAYDCTFHPIMKGELVVE